MTRFVPISIAACLWMPAVASAAPAGDPIRASADIDTSALADEARSVESRLDADLKALLLDQEVLPAHDPADATIRVVVSFGGTDDDPAYDVTMTIVRDGTPLGDATRSFTCELCTHGDLASRAAEEFGVLVQRLRADAAAANENDPSGPVTGPAIDPGAEGPAPEGPSVEPAGPGHDATQDQGESAPIGLLGGLGIGLGATGLAGVAAGAVLISRPASPTEASQFRDQRTFQAPGVATLAGGATLLVVGTVLFVVDRVRAKKRGHSVRASATRPPTTTSIATASFGGL